MKENTQIQLISTPEANPEPSNFAVLNTPMPTVKQGEVLLKNLYLSLDPYMRSQMAGRHMSGTVSSGDLMRGETVARVIESKHPDYKSGDIVRGFGNWQVYASVPGDMLVQVSKDIKPASYALSILGMPGLTAYAGLIWQAKPKPGDVVVIPAATGGVGATAGQLAKIYGCTVIGIAGTDEKCAYANQELGYDACINRKTEDIEARLKELCPNGVNIYFDLVGGEMLHIVSRNLALGARIILCGLMADYNSKTRSMGPPPGAWIGARAILYGLVVYDFEHRRDEFLAACLPHIQSGRLKMQEDVSYGIESAPEGFCRLMRGGNFGKAIVSLSED